MQDLVELIKDWLDDYTLTEPVIKP
jgi:hypothetical protein